MQKSRKTKWLQFSNKKASEFSEAFNFIYDAEASRNAFTLS